MPRQSVIQTNFNAGELSPYLEGRVDLAKYPNGCKVLQNFLATVQGPAVKRSGTRFLGAIKTVADSTWLIPFVVSNIQAYMLEFGDFYMRVWKDSAAVVDLQGIATATPSTNPLQLTITGHPFSTGDRVIITGVSNGGMVQVANREFLVTKIDANTIKLRDSQTGVDINGSSYDAWSGTATISRPYEIVTPYPKTAVSQLAYAQSADVLYLAHPSYASRKVSRTSHTSWTIAAIAFDHPPMVSRNTDPAKTLFFEDEPTPNPALPANAKSGLAGQHIVITSTTAANPVNVLATAHGLTTGQYVWIEGVTTMTQINERGFRITKVDANNFTLDGEDGTGYSAGTGGYASECRSLAAYVGQIRISSITQAANGVVTTLGNHGFSTSDNVILHGCDGMTEVNGQTFTVTFLTTTTFQLNVNTTAYGAYLTTYRRGLCVKASVLDAASIFVSGDVSGYYGLYEQPASFYEFWHSTSAQGFYDHQTVHYQGNVYSAIQAASAFPEFSGTIPPTHTEPGFALWDAEVATRAAGTGIRWQFEHSGQGYVRVAKFINGGLVYAFVPRTARSQKIPFGCIRKRNDAAATDEFEETPNWARGAFSTRNGFARAVCFFEDRLSWAGTSANPQSFWMSRPGDYENHRPSDDDESSIFATLNTDDVNVVEWMSPGKVLILGTSGGEFIVSANSLDEALTATNIRAVRHTAYGARAAVPPRRLENALLFVQRAGRKLREFAYDFDSDTYRAHDLSVLADHLSRPKIRSLAFQQEPTRSLWCMMDDGTLACLTYERSLDVVGWQRHVVGGASVAIESIAVIPHPTKAADQLWMLVKRTVSAATVRYVEILEQAWEDGDAIADGFFVDSGLTYSGSAVTSVGGLWHLNGESVDVLGDGVVQTDKPVSNGKITGLTSAAKFQVGLNYAAKLQTMRIEAGSADGTSQGKIRRIYGLVLRLFQTGSGLLYGAFDDTSKQDALEMKDEQDPLGAAVTLFTGDTAYLPWPEGYEQHDARVVLTHSDPTPCTIVAIMPQITAQARG